MASISAAAAAITASRGALEAGAEHRGETAANRGALIAVCPLGLAKAEPPNW